MGLVKALTSHYLTPSGLLGETEGRVLWQHVCVFHRAQSAPSGCYSTKGSDITTETGGRDDGVKDEDRSGSGQRGSRITPLQLLYLSHKHSEDSPVKPESWQLQKTTLPQKQRQQREKGKKRKTSIGKKKASRLLPKHLLFSHSFTTRYIRIWLRCTT